MIDPIVYDRLQIGSADEVRPAATLLRDLVWRAVGMHVAPSHNIASRAPMQDENGASLAETIFRSTRVEPWWLDRKLALRSPLAAACRLTAEPFWCNASGLRFRSESRLLRSIDLRDFAARARTRSAIVVPVHLPFGQIAAASLLPDDPLCEDLSEPFAAHINALAIYVRRFLVSYVETMQPKPRVTGTAALTKREVECLRWAAAGKTNEEIAVILGLSRPTVRFHIRNASTKLDAVNRDHAIFKAAQLGFLALAI